MRFSDYQQGDNGAGVTDLQRNLASVGYNIDVDGVFGGETAAAVEHFQAARGVKDDPTGVAGPGTLIALASAKAAGWRQSGFFYLYIGGTGMNQTAAEVPVVSMDRKKLGVLAAIGLGAAWYFYGR